MTAVSVTLQLDLPDDLVKELGIQAQKLNLALEELIRQTMREKLSALQSMPPSAEDPLAFMRGKIETDEQDWAARIDETLYGGGVR